MRDRVPRAYVTCVAGLTLASHFFRSRYYSHSLDSPPPRLPPRSRRGTQPRMFAPPPSRPISALIATRRSSSHCVIAPPINSHCVIAPPISALIATRRSSSHGSLTILSLSSHGSLTAHPAAGLAAADFASRCISTLLCACCGRGGCRLCISLHLARIGCRLDIHRSGRSRGDQRGDRPGRCRGDLGFGDPER